MLVVAVIALNAPDGNDKTAAERSTGAAPATSRPATASPSSSNSPTPTTRPSSRPSGPTLSLGNSSDSSSDPADKSVPLVVLNNTTTNGLATDAARQFREGGWKVDEIGNLQNEIISTCAYYDPGVRGAERAAKALQRQFPAIKRVVEKFDGLPSGPIVVVLTPDYATG